MPIYEYHCQNCLKDHEIIQKVSDEPLKICPACGAKLEKKLSLSGFHLKGGGWYKDGYTSTTSSNPPKTQDKKTEGKPAETKPASPPKPPTKTGGE